MVTSHVVVPQIYGGGWVEGDSWEKGRYNGVKMAKARNVVVVASTDWGLAPLEARWYHRLTLTVDAFASPDPAVNYRLGALGFMALPSLAAESGQVGNVGLLDQRYAPCGAPASPR